MSNQHLKVGDVLKGVVQTVTASYADLGGEIFTCGYNKLAIYIDIDINTSDNIRLQFLGKMAADATNEYIIDTSDVTAVESLADNVREVADANYVEFSVDADQKRCVVIPLHNITPFVQIQVKAGTLGTAAIINSAYVVLG